MSNRKLDADNAIDELLILALKVRETLKDPKKWCQYTRHNEHGQFCVIGHVEQALGIEWWTVPLDRSEACRDKAREMFGAMGVYDCELQSSLLAAVSHNNSHTHAEVLERFDEGIENLRRRNTTL